MPPTSCLAGLFFLSAILNATSVFARGRGGGGGGHGVTSTGAPNDLPPIYNTIFALVIAITIFTISQFIRAVKRLRMSALPTDTLTPTYQVGKLFPSLLLVYTFAFIAYNALYAAFVDLVYTPAPSYNTLPVGFRPGMSFVGQVADVTFLATFLSLIAYRERLQLNPAQSAFNLKTFLDGCILSIILIIGVVADALNGVDIRNLNIVYQAFLFVASVYLLGSAIVVHVRFGKSNIHDQIIRDITFIVSPLICVGAVFQIVNIGLVYNTRDVFFNFAALNLAAVIISGLISIIVIEIALRMGLPKPIKVVVEEGSKRDSNKA